MPTDRPTHRSTQSARHRRLVELAIALCAMAPDQAARAQSRNAPPQARAPDAAAARAASAYTSGEWAPPAAADTRSPAQPSTSALPRRADDPAPAAGPAPANDLYLDVSLNGEPTHLIVHFAIVDGRAFASEDDLNDLGIATSRLRQPANALVALDALDGLRYRYDATRQTMALVVPDALRIPHTLDTRALAPSPPASAGRGVVLNYDLYTQTAGGASAALWHEARYFDPAGVFSSTGVAAFQHAGQRYTRYDTSWSRSNPASLSTVQIGDTVSSSLAWTRSLRIGGWQWRSNFALRPDLVTFPVPALAGTAVVPSSVDLYVNGVRQFSGDVPSGPFVINSVPGITGAGNATVITHDALGRTIATSLPLYVDTRLLAAGLSSYSVEAGFLRRAWGLRSFDYASRPAASATLRYGVNDRLTLEAYAQATPGLYSAGAGALTRVGGAGVASASVAQSTGRLAGTQVGLGYQLIQPHWSIDAATLRAFARYGDLAARDGTPVPNATDRVTLSLPLAHAQTFALSYVGFKYPGTRASRIGSVAYSASIGGLSSISISAFRDFRQHDSNGVFVSLNVSLGNRTSLNANAGRQNGKATYSVSATRAPDYGGGFGWAAQAGDAGGTRYAQAQAQYLGRAGEVTALAQTVAGQHNAALDVTGAIVLMDGNALLSRRIDDGFALVSTDASAGVPVLHENRVIGATDRNGHLLIPDLNAYQNNRIGIDALKLPLDARVSATTQTIVPQSRSGVLARFAIAREQSASIALRDAAGAPLPPGLTVTHRESATHTIVGYDGLTFVSALAPVNHLDIEAGGKRCTVSFDYTRPADGAPPTIGPLTCDLK
ncbi:fimbria/pilus outer membrane usher protein [Burkholderia singularis]|uniref:fimbria/pilus outer membrane usher protein n=1 Tax=Burkholderia singularis TaxID=1503053 RepID=UPI002113B347|nr:fimbria/pilus outer membrane usher protein [Burkholderia singularis]